MPTTSNFGWTTPADTDLVKDGAAAIRTLGNGIDTSLVDLKGGTTGQILSKNSNTDLDYTWINNDQGDITAVTAGTGISGGGTTGAVTITNDMATTVTASGDIIVGTGNGTYDNLPIGTTGQILTADTTVSPYKVKWAAAPVSGANWALLNSGGTALSGAATVTVSGISGKDKILILLDGAKGTGAQNAVQIRFNTDTGNNYYRYGVRLAPGSTYAANQTQQIAGVNSGPFIGAMSTNSNSVVSGYCYLTGCDSSGVKAFWGAGSGSDATGSDQNAFVFGGYYDSATVISSISIFNNSANFSAGTVYVYTSA